MIVRWWLMFFAGFTTGRLFEKIAPMPWLIITSVACFIFYFGWLISRQLESS